MATVRRRCCALLAGFWLTKLFLLSPVASLAPPSTTRRLPQKRQRRAGGGGGGSPSLGADRGADPSSKIRESGTAASAASSGASSSKPPATTLAVRIRRTVASDLPAVSGFLSAAAVAASSSSRSSFWKTKMDQLWARHDYERLLKRRLRAIEEGRKAAARVDASAAFSSTTLGEERSCDEERLYLEHLWRSSDQLRTEIAAAAQETGEDSVWRRRGVTLLPPASRHWLNHVQLTATATTTTTAVGKGGGKREEQVVVGFVEVAMLSNPCFGGADDEECRIAVAAEDSENSSQDHDDRRARQQCVVFSPAVTNLAVAPEHRRRGVGHRLLASAEAYVSRNWGGTSLGLYVQPNNVGANALYGARGYHRRAALDDDRLGRLWYRSKVLSKNRSKREIDEMAEVAEESEQESSLEEDTRKNNLVLSR